MPELSVVVPVYKVEKYLERCINSILCQTFTNFELILVDDGSPDDCGNICDMYAQKDMRIKVIHQDNRGVSSARNSGIRIANGEYIVFLDSDDYIERDMFEIMITIAKERKVDVVICGINYCGDDGRIYRSGLNYTKYYDKEQLLKALFGKPNPIGGGCANKLFKFNKKDMIFFQEGVSLLEDTMYLLDKFCICNNAYQIEKSLYNVVERRESATRSNEIEVMYKIILSSEQLVYKSRDYSKELESKAMDKFLDNCLRYVALMQDASKINCVCIKDKIKYIRKIMFKMILRAIKCDLLSKAQIKGYFIGMCKL